MADIQFVRKCTAELMDSMGDDYAIVQAAIVSTGVDREAYNEVRSEGLIRRLMHDRHGSPFEQVEFKFMLDMPIFTARQLMRHRVAEYNEVSGRYRIMEPRFYLPPVNRPIKQADGSKIMDYELEVDEALSTITQQALIEQSTLAWQKYEHLIEVGISREVARMVLPKNLMTQIVAKWNLRSIFNFLSVRGIGPSRFPSHPQWEISQLAAEIEEAVMRITPIAHVAFCDGGRVAP